ncbi:MAG TPA: ATP-binding cassette domain-containing protein, partial [Longimicrobium sp.]|nr:ATP-binding cassette domain-containing protein [Longimicrobium sp.]
MSGFDALVDATGPGDLSKLIALRALVDRVNGDGTVERANWLTGVRQEYQRWYARHGEGNLPENFPGSDTLHYLDEHIVRILAEDGVLEPVARAEPGAAPDLPPAPAEAPEARPGGMLVPGGATLSATGLVKVYRKRRVVNEVDLQVSQGEIVGLLGPNGAGKTTSFYMMVGLIR